MRKINTIIFLSILFAINTAWSTKYYVKPTGNDANSGLTEPLAWQHVMKACSTVVAGDTVLIRAGRYDEISAVTTATNPNVAVWSYPAQAGLLPTNTGTAGHPIVFKGYPGDTRPIIIGKSTYYATDAAARADGLNGYRPGVRVPVGYAYLTYDSLEFRFGCAGFYIARVNNIIVRNCIIDSTLGSGGSPLDDNSGAILTYFTQDANGPRNITVEGNEFFANGAWRIGAGTPNYVAGFNTGGMWLYTCDSCLIQNNVIHDCMNGIRFKEEARYTEVKGNTLYNIPYNALWSHSLQQLAYTGPDKVLSRWHHNIVYNSACAFQVGSGTNVSVYDSLLYVYNNTFDMTNSIAWGAVVGAGGIGGIQGEQGAFHKAYFFNNIFYNPPSFVNSNFTTHHGAINIWYNTAPISQIYSDYNLIYGSGGSGAKYYAIGSGAGYTMAEWRAASIPQMTPGQGANDRYGDPLFVSAATHNYNLQTGSPALTGGKGGSFTFFPGTARASTVTLPTYLGALGDSSVTPAPFNTVKQNQTIQRGQVIVK